MGVATVHLDTWMWMCRYFILHAWNATINFRKVKPLSSCLYIVRKKSSYSYFFWLSRARNKNVKRCALIMKMYYDGVVADADATVFGVNNSISRSEYHAKLYFVCSSSYTMIGDLSKIRGAPMVVIVPVLPSMIIERRGRVGRSSVSMFFLRH